jgi:glycosyltransferase 2 family protein
MKFGWRAVLGIGISVVFLYFAFKNLDLAEAIKTAREANYWLLILSAATATCMFPLRARRWQTILDPVAPNLPFGPLWRATAIGVMVTNVVPLRAGELARPLALTRQLPKVSFSTSLASVAVDRVFDGIVVMVLLAIGVVVAHFPTNTTIRGYSLTHAAGFVVGGALALLVAFYVLVFFPRTLIRAFELVARRVSPAIERRGAEMLARFSEGLSVLRTPGHFIAVFGWTLAHWLVQPLAFWLAFMAVGVQVPFAATLIVQGIIVILVALPSAPGFFGPFEYGAAIGLSLYRIGQSQAATWALLFHIASFIPITLIGAYYALQVGFSLGDMRGPAPDAA